MNNHFYGQYTRKIITHFGNIFNNITLVKYNKSHTVELERIKVPIIYSNKEAYLFLLQQDPDKTKQIQIVLPSMCFELMGIRYDSNRRLNQLTKHNKRNASETSYAQYRGVPYDLDFTLTIYTRHSDDAFQIVEQILPIFQPEFNISVNLQTEMGRIIDIPVILNNINAETQFNADLTKTKYNIWELSFTVKAEYYGPIDQAKIIKKAIANTYLDPTLSTGYIIRLNMDKGNYGEFKEEDIVYQGNSPDDSKAMGIVIDWERNANTGYLRIGGVQGTFQLGNLYSQSTNAIYNIESFDTTPIKVVSQTVFVDPLSANIGDPYNIISTIEEFPDV